MKKLRSDIAKLEGSEVAQEFVLDCLEQIKTGWNTDDGSVEAELLSWLTTEPADKDTSTSPDLQGLQAENAELKAEIYRMHDQLQNLASELNKAQHYPDCPCKEEQG